jgi:hypothetical protein
MVAKLPRSSPWVHDQAKHTEAGTPRFDALPGQLVVTCPVCSAAVTLTKLGAGQHLRGHVQTERMTAEERLKILRTWFPEK